MTPECCKMEYAKENGSQEEIGCSLIIGIAKGRVSRLPVAFLMMALISIAIYFAFEFELVGRLVPILQD